MRRQGRWILAATLGCFIAGTTVGWLLPDTLTALAARSEEGGASEVFVRRFSEGFGLTADQQRKLRMIVRSREMDELEVLRQADFQKLPPPLQAQIQNVRRKEEERIRWLLDEQQRKRYDETVRPESGR